MLKKKIWANFQRIVAVFTKKNFQYALKYMGLGSEIWDPGSGKNLFRIPDSGVKKAPDPGSATLALDLYHWICSFAVIRRIQSEIIFHLNPNLYSERLGTVDHQYLAYL
jgi:hypothetical protein